METNGRTKILQDKYPRKQQWSITEEGKGEKFAREEIEKAMKRIPASFPSHQEMAKPGTINDQFASEMYYYVLSTSNPNNVDPHMFLGSYELEREAMSITAKLLNFPEDTKNVGGWFLNGGTEAILQATWMYRNKYFFDKFRNIEAPEFLKGGGGKEGMFRDLFSLREYGWFKLYPEYAKYHDRNEKIPVPKILAPFDAHFALKKAADILGFGQNNIEYFFLDDNGRPDPKSIREKAEKIIREGNEIVMTWITVGDTTRGVLSDTENLDYEVSCAIKGKQDFKPPTLVDAAAQYLFAAVMNSSDKYVDAEGINKEIPVWDFRVENVRAIVADPHKNQIPYPASMLLIRDAQDTQHTIMETEYLSIDLMSKVGSMNEKQIEATSHSATIPTSRTGYSPAATWAYYVNYGLAEIRRRKEKIWELVMRLRNAIKNDLGEMYELICEPDSAIVSFAISKEWIRDNEARLIKEIHEKAGQIESWIDITPSIDLLAGIATYKIYEGINESSQDFLYIGRSEELWIKKEEEFKDFQHLKEKLIYKKLEEKRIDTTVYNYMGLIVHIMEHNREKDIVLLVKRLKEEALSMVKRT
jgi:glutamate/tyrosine decarboxylase-like PLP-dependent enzyme